MRDNYTAKRTNELEAAEIVQAELDYREERITFDDLFMFCQSFDKGVTIDGVISALGRNYRGD